MNTRSVNHNYLRSKLVDLDNTILWDRKSDRKAYVEIVNVAVGGAKFESRQVRLRFKDGPEMDFTVFDMNRLVDAYLKLRDGM